jgi:hypothetical protein
MNPSSNESSPGISLPPPAEQSGNMQSGAGSASEHLPQPEQQAGAAESASRNAAAQAAPIVPAMPAPTTGTVSAKSDDSSTTNSISSSLLKDDDLIEKEWVDKAKAIVERTRDDPYKQSEEMTLMKADYMKKRYNKTIKVEK